MPQTNRINKINSYVKKLSKTQDKWVSLALAIGIADEVMKGILPNSSNFHSQLIHYDEETPRLPNPLSMDVFRTQKQETWFASHPTIGSARIALNHFNDDNSLIESRFFWFSDKETKQKIAATTQLVSNWEDSDLTRNKNYKVAVDFFLTQDTNTLMIVLTNRQKLRVMELNGSLSNTQKQILSEKLFAFSSIEEKNQYFSQEIIHNSLWEAFELSEVNNKFYRGISELHYELTEYLVKENDLTIENAKQFSTRLLGRLLFVWFLRKMDLIDENMNYFETNGLSSTKYYQVSLEPLFFHTLNVPIKERVVTIKDENTPYLNGGLFEINENDYYNTSLNFPDNYFENIYKHFNKFNFTVDESSVDYELVAVDPEMLGQIFESLLASQLEEDNINERKTTGSFYTPRHIVDYMSKESIRQYLYREINNQKFEKGIDDLIDMTDAKFIERKSSSTMDLWGTNTRQVRKRIEIALNKIKILDPAVGSGAFPMGILQIMSKLYERILPANSYNSYQVKLNIIKNNLFGVDIQPMAIEITRLRAWLAIIVDDYHDNMKVNPLPNLEFKFVSANSLAKLDTQGSPWANPELDIELSEIRQKYFNARTTQSKNRWKNKYYKITRESDLFDDKRNQQLRSFDPFNNVLSATFFDSNIMFGISHGFDVVIGNPPYIHFQKMELNERNTYRDLKYETYAARGDIYALFYELGINLLNEQGILTYITSNKWMRTEYGKKLRNYFIKNVNPLILIDLGEGIFEHATVDTNILILESKSFSDEITALTLQKEDINHEIKENSVQIKFNFNEIWTILNPIEIKIKEKIETYGLPLKEWDIKIRRGILTGLNEAFLISKEVRDKLIEKEPNSSEVIYPLLRGRDVRKYEYKFANTYIINTHNGYTTQDGEVVKNIAIEDYPAIKSHLEKYEPKLSKRYDQGITPYNLRSVNYMQEFFNPKIMYSEIVKSPQFYLDENGSFFPEASTFILTGDHLEYLIHWLNSDIIAWIFKTYYAGGGLGKGFRYKRAFLEQLPIPYPEEKYNLNKENINSFIVDNYNLSDEEVKYIKENIRKN